MKVTVIQTEEKFSCIIVGTESTRSKMKFATNSLLGDFNKPLVLD